MPRIAAEPALQKKAVEGDPTFAPRQEPAKGSLRYSLASYTVACVLCAYLLTWAYPLRKLDLKIPLDVGGDALLASLVSKTLMEQPWVFTNPRLGAPGMFEVYDFPTSDSLHLFLLKFITLWTNSYGLALNTFFLLGFLFITCTTLFVLHEMGLSYPSSIAGGLLYAFCPYHIFRGLGHIFLGCYYVIPLTVWMIMQVQSWTPDTRPLLILRGWRWPRLTKAGAVAVLICILTGCSGVYYAFFAVLLLGAVGLADCLASRSFRRLGIALVLASLIGFTVFLNIAPTSVYNAVHGPNFSVAVRSAYESELYGLKVLQLLLPIDPHRISVFNHFRGMYGAVENESKSASLGVFGSIGFAFLLIALLTGFLKSNPNIRRLAFLNLFCILIGVAGGFGTVFAFFVSPQIRGYNRISIYIAFFSIAAFFIVLEKLLDRLGAKRLNATVRGAILAVVCGGVVMAGFLDQVRAPNVNAGLAREPSVREMEGYIGQLEARLPRGAMVLQLPYMSFPEAGPVNQMVDYEPLGAYLCSTRLRWSYGAMRGRYSDAWIAFLSTRPAGQLLEYAALAGYQGILVTRVGFQDRGAALEKVFQEALHEQPIQNSAARYAFYDLRPYINRLHSNYSEADWQTAQSNVLHPLVYGLRGCSSAELASVRYNWCTNDARIVIENSSNSTQRLRMHGRLVDGSPGFASIKVQSASVSETHEMRPGEFFSLEKEIEVPPGRLVYHITSDALPLLPPGDPRSLYFRLESLAFTEDSQVVADPPKGCYDVEHGPDQDFRWCQSQADIAIKNTFTTARETYVRFKLATGDPRPATVQVEGPGFSEKVKSTPAGSVFEHPFVLPVGESHLRITTNARKVNAPKDARTLVFRMMDFQLEDKVPPKQVIGIN